MVFLSKSKDIRTYNCSWNVGGGIGYDFHKDNILSTTFFATATHSIGNVDLKNMSYNAGIKFNTQQKALKLSFGIGYKYIKSLQKALSFQYIYWILTTYLEYDLNKYTEEYFIFHAKINKDIQFIGEYDISINNY